MGTSMASVAFRSGPKSRWEKVKTQIEDMFLGVDRLVSNFEDEEGQYAIVSPYGDMSMFLAELPQKISSLTGDYAVMTVCVDSDFAMMELYFDGVLVERSCIGDMYDEVDEMFTVTTPSPEHWEPLLIDKAYMEQLQYALLGREVFVEAQLLAISKYTGLPIFDEKLVYETL